MRILFAVEWQANDGSKSADAPLARIPAGWQQDFVLHGDSKKGTAECTYTAGSGVLEFELEPLPGGGTRVGVTAYWHPQGVWGLLYWYALVPAHLFIFRGMTAAIARRAEALRL